MTPETFPCIFALQWRDWGCWISWLATVGGLILFTIIFGLGLWQGGVILCAINWHAWLPLGEDDDDVPGPHRHCKRCDAVKAR